MRTITRMSVAMTLLFTAACAAHRPKEAATTPPHGEAGFLRGTPDAEELALDAELVLRIRATAVTGGEVVRMGQQLDLQPGDEFRLEVRSSRQLYLYTRGRSAPELALENPPPVDAVLLSSYVPLLLPDDERSYRVLDPNPEQRMILIASRAPLSERAVNSFAEMLEQREGPGGSGGEEEPLTVPRTLDLTTRSGDLLQQEQNEVLVTDGGDGVIVYELRIQVSP